MGSTFNQMKERLNSRLQQYNQKTRVDVYEKCKIILNSKQVLEGSNKREFVYRVLTKKSPDIWTANIDKLLLGEISKNELKRLICVKGGKSCQAKHKEKIRKNLNSGIPWNKGKTNLQTAWNKGLTKKTNLSIMKLAESRKGSGNPMFGKKHTLEYKKKQSKRVKESILTGKFTPNSNNRNTHWDVVFDGKKFRSSWEAVFYALHSDFEYESLRIPYIIDGEEKIYIVDFCNHVKKHVVEVKPKELLNDRVTEAKISALKQWALKNHYTFEIFTQDSIVQNISKLDITVFDQKTQKKLSGMIHEANKKNRN